MSTAYAIYVEKKIILKEANSPQVSTKNLFNILSAEI